MHLVDGAFNDCRFCASSADGQMILAAYGGGAYNCVNSPWREWSFQAIRDLAAYQIDGIFLDGPIFVQNGCYCVSCQKKFRRIYGTELSCPDEMNDQARRAFIDFRYRSIADYVREVRETLKKRRPEAVLYMNGLGMQPGRASARDNRRLVNYQDLLGAEGGYGASVDLPFWRTGATAKLLETQVQGKPVVIFTTSFCSPRPRYFRTSAETKLRFADLAANGANPHYWAYLPSVNAKNPGVGAAAQMNRFIARHAGYFKGSISAAQVVLENAPQTLEVVLRRQPDEERILVHLINFTGEMQRPMEKVIPIRDVRVKVMGKKARRVYSLTMQKDLEFKANNEWIEFVVPRIEIYEVIVIEA